MPNAPAVRITQLGKSFSGSEKVVQDISLEIEEGEIFGLLGPNGAGKSTTINMMSGVTRIGNGKIEIFGYDNQRDFEVTRRLIGVMHQEIVVDNFFPLEATLKIHSGFYGVKDDPEWRNLLIDRLALRPHLKKTMLKLSGGMKRRLMIAKALIHQPKLLILDEPTAGVDVELRHSLWSFVREINKKGTTILLTTHYLEEAENMCGRIAIMDHGKIVELGRTNDIVSKLDERKLSFVFESPLPVEQLTILKDFEVEPLEGGRRLTFVLKSAENNMAKILETVQSLPSKVIEVENQAMSLEQAFIKLTGGNQA